MIERCLPIPAPGRCGLVLAALLLATGGPAAGQQSAAPATVEYQPPDVGAPPTRVLAATRGLGAAPVAQVLVPEQTGLTHTAQPTLFWYLSAPATTRLELTLIDEDAVDPLLELDLGVVAEPGIHALDLAAHDVRLEPGRQYQWSVAQVVDPAQPSADIVTSGTLERRAPGPELAAMLTDASPTGRLSALAGHGYWYDLLAELEAQLEAAPDAAALRALRAQLLDQVGLDAIAAGAARAPVVQ